MPSGSLPTHSHLRHPLTGEPMRALGLTKSGKAIWPAMGGSQPAGEPAPTVPPTPAPAPATPPVPTPPPAPATAPAPPAPPAAPVPAAPPATGNGEHGFPENTPLAQMTDGQQAAYWRYHARKHEARASAMSDYEQLKQQATQLAELQAASMTEQQRAVAEAEKRGRTAALAESGSKLVDAFMRAALNNRLGEEQIKALISPLDRTQFLTADGLSVDTDKVNAFASVVAPAAQAAPQVPAPGQASTTTPPAASPATGAQQPVPDMGQGRTTSPKPSGLEAGRAIAAQRFGKNKPAQQ